MGKMKRFVDMEYQRPDFEAEKAARRQYVEQIEQAKSKEELVDVIVKEDERSRMMWTMYDLAYIRNTIDTTDPFYEQEMSNFYKEIGELSLLGQQAEEAVLRSPYRGEIWPAASSGHGDRIKTDVTERGGRFDGGIQTVPGI